MNIVVELFDFFILIFLDVRGFIKYLSCFFGVKFKYFGVLYFG